MFEIENKHDRAYRALENCRWASSLLRKIDEGDGVRKAPPGLLFELRFAFELTIYCPKATPTYEFSAGVADSTVDFRIEWADKEWLIELVSLRESKTVRTMRSESKVEIEPGISCEGLFLDSIDPSLPNPDFHRTQWGELIRVSEKIREKVWDGGTARKFPPRTPERIQVILVDMFGFEGTGDPNPPHCLAVAWGSAQLPEAYGRGLCHPKTGEPVKGLFDPNNTERGAIEIRKRVDMIGFVAEHPGYEQDDEIGRNVYLIVNPAIPDGRELIQAFPVRSCDSLRNPLGVKG